MMRQRARIVRGAAINRKWLGKECAMRMVRALTYAVLLLASGAALAETNEVKISKGFGVPYLPMMVMQDRGLLEKHAAAAGLGDIKVTWATIDGGNVITDAMLAGALDIATIGPPAFATLWNKTQNMPQLRINGIAAVSSGTVYLNTRNPNIKSLKDFGPNDRIAVPGIKTSAVAMILQIGAEKEFGTENFAKLDSLTVGLPHPEAVQAMLAGKSEINSHFASQPFAAVELRDKNIHTVIDSNRIFGGPTTVIMAFTSTRFHDANPKTYRAFLAALKEADDMINADKRAAAETFVKLSGARAKIEDVMVSLDDPGTIFTTTPQGVMQYFDFMHRAKLIAAKPGSWKNVFFPEIHDIPGS
jgi:NitT/TauT family transport system substrate-binding protein